MIHRITRRALAPTLALLAVITSGCEDEVKQNPPPKEKGSQAAGEASTGASTAIGASTADPRNLYERLGGEPAIQAVVDEFLARVGSDARINKRFEGANMPRLRDLLVQQICAASGGPQPYKGRDMKVVHAGMGIQDAEFDALVDDLIGALDKFKVPVREKSELLAALGPMRADIVEKPPTAEERLARAEARITRLERAIDALNMRLDAVASHDPGAGATTGGKSSGKSSMGGKGAPRPAPSPAPAAGKGGMEKPAAQPKAKTAAKFEGFTDAEKALAAELVERYSNAEAKQGEARSDLVGSRLPHTAFFSSNGDAYDVSHFEGRKRLVLVIMRGFAGAVCINCSTQTLSLADKIEEFKAKNAEVVLVYPGEVETVAAFLDAVRSLREGFAPPFPIVLDVDLAAVRTYSIQGSLAKPTTLILDEKGIVRYAYVGKQPADRPSAADMLKALDAIPAAE